MLFKNKLSLALGFFFFFLTKAATPFFFPKHYFSNLFCGLVTCLCCWCSPMEWMTEGWKWGIKLPHRLTWLWNCKSWFCAVFVCFFQAICTLTLGCGLNLSFLFMNLALLRLKLPQWLHQIHNVRNGLLVTSHSERLFWMAQHGVDCTVHNSMTLK